MRFGVRVAALVIALALLTAASSVAAAGGQALCDRGDTFRTLHRDEDAAAAYKKALETDPKLQCAIDGLEAAGPSRVGRIVDNVTAALPQYVFVLALLLAIGFAGLLVGHWKVAYAWLVQRPVAGRILKPRLNIEPFGDNSGKDVGTTIDAQVKRWLVRMREELVRDDAPELELDFGAPREDFDVTLGEQGGLKAALEKASAASEQTALIAAIANVLYAILPIPRITVAGVVEPEGGPAAAATLSLAMNGTLQAAATVNAPAVPSGAALAVADFLKLAHPAAVWVQYEFTRAISGGRALAEHGAESYVYVQEGLQHQFAGDFRRAVEMYETALALADDNWAAQLNEAMTEARLALNYPAAVEILRKAFDRIRVA